MQDEGWRFQNNLWLILGGGSRGETAPPKQTSAIKTRNRLLPDTLQLFKKTEKISIPEGNRVMLLALFGQIYQNLLLKHHNFTRSVGQKRISWPWVGQWRVPQPDEWSLDVSQKLVNVLSTFFQCFHVQRANTSRALNDFVHLA